MTTRTVPLDCIIADPQAQPRAQLDDDVVAEYADAMREGATFPPLVVFEDADGTLWLADGFHRLEAARRAGLTEITVEVRPGGLRDAIFFSIGANAHHGLRRSNEDKRRAVEKLLADSEWREWSDRRIAEVAGVSAPFVATVRADASVNGLQIDPASAASDAPVGRDSEVRLVERNGTVFPMATAGIGKAPKAASATMETGDDEESGPGWDEDGPEAEEEDPSEEDPANPPGRKDEESEAALERIGFRALRHVAEAVGAKLKDEVDAAETDDELRFLEAVIHAMENDILVHLGIRARKADIRRRLRLNRNPKKPRLVDGPVADPADDAEGLEGDTDE